MISIHPPNATISVLESLTETSVPMILSCLPAVSETVRVQVVSSLELTTNPPEIKDLDQSPQIEILEIWDCREVKQKEVGNGILEIARITKAMDLCFVGWEAHLQQVLDKGEEMLKETMFLRFERCTQIRVCKGVKVVSLWRCVDVQVQEGTVVYGLDGGD